MGLYLKLKQEVAMDKEIRWRQRFQNFEKSFLFLKESCKQSQYNRLEVGGLVKAFDSSFELAWKTLKDFFEAQGQVVKYPREVLKYAFEKEVIQNGHLWIEMLDKRNELSHTYNQSQIDKAVKVIKETYFPGIETVYQYLKAENEQKK